MSTASRADRLTVVALCERLADGDAIARRLEPIEHVDLHVLVCRNRRKPARFVAAAALDLARRPRLAALLAKRRWAISAGTLDGGRARRFLERLGPDVGLHASSVIYRRPVIDLFRLGILNPHIGLLPEYRGRSVMEWSLLHGDPAAITTFFIDEGIDTGPSIVLRETVDLSGFDDVASAKAHLFGLNVEMFERALRMLGEPGFEPATQDVSQGRRYYVMSELFSGVVERMLRR
jgi:folate-dependent phosphoribosylglycinamide formyltransferase PurN